MASIDEARVLVECDALQALVTEVREIHKQLRAFRADLAQAHRSPMSAMEMRPADGRSIVRR
jgi:hypothetical protein